MSLLRNALACCSSQTLPPENDPQVRALVERMRMVARNPMLPAPEVFDTSSFPSLNLVASYFDNPEPLSRQELQYEDRCQRSDIFLAEALCCFEILHIWLERSVRVPKSCRQRLYAIRDDAREVSPTPSPETTSKSQKMERAPFSSYREGEENDFPIDRPLRESSTGRSPLTAYPYPDETPSRTRSNEMAPIDRLVERSFSESPREPLSTILRRENPERMNRETLSYEAAMSRSSVPQSEEKTIRAPRRDQPSATYGHRERSVWRTILQGFQTLVLTALIFCFLLWVIPIVRHHYLKPQDPMVTEESQEGNEDPYAQNSVDEEPAVKISDTPRAGNERLALRPRENRGGTLQIDFSNPSKER